ncbi:MAG TPA: hypothetical protein VFX33_04785 [Actinomycetales bacterium]|nr:hypothetical protein [Actinomycetales bacterium]
MTDRSNDPMSDPILDPMSDIESRLASALRTGLDDDPVPVTSLLQGARRKATRIRRRRQVGVAGVAAIAVAAAPFGVQTFLEGSPRDGATHIASSPGPSTDVSTPTDAPPSPSASDEPSAAPSESVPSSEPPQQTEPPQTDAPTSSKEPSRPRFISLAAPKSFPDDLGFRSSDLRPPLQLTLDLGNYRKVSTVSGQECVAEPGPSAGRVWQWAEENSNRLDQVSVALTLTGWANGRGTQAIADVADDTGVCRWSPGTKETKSGDLPGDGKWAATRTMNGLHQGFAVVELGDVLVAVSVSHPDGEQAAVDEAKRLVVMAAERVSARLG